jgi:hypothetical protein
MRRAVVTLVAAMASALAVAVPLGVADTVSGTDSRGDVEGNPAGGAERADIVRATAGTNSRGQLTHTVTIAGSAADPKGGGIVPALYIELPDQANAVAECAVLVGQFRGRLGVFRCGTGERLGSAKVVRTSTHTTRYTFSKAALGNPSSYDWAVVTRANATDNGSWTRHDRLPSSDDEYLRYSLR